MRDKNEEKGGSIERTHLVAVADLMLHSIGLINPTRLGPKLYVDFLSIFPLDLVRLVGLFLNTTSVKIFEGPMLPIDQRTSGWFLMSNPIPIVSILFAYLYFVLKCGPNYMKDKQPYSLKKIIMVYNIFQVAANIFLFREAFYMWSRFNWNCQPLDLTMSVFAIRQAWGCYLYFLNKISDLLDTVFFVLRKKDRQISFLHLFHHTIMPLMTWIMVKYFPGGHVTFIGLPNTFVHILLYGYYYLAALGPNVQKYLWWKKYITKLQLLQFCLVFIHNTQLLFFDCDFPKWTVILTLPNTIFFYYLFDDFYKKSYIAPKTDDKQKESIKSK